MKKPTVGIVCGGLSSESEISKKSGQTVFDQLSSSLWEVYMIVIGADEWLAFDSQKNKYQFSKGDFKIKNASKEITIDVVFNAVHGRPGEDGQLAALFQLLNLPHTGCSSYSAAITYNKRDCLAVLRAHDIPMARSYYLDATDTIDEEAIVQTVGLPCFVKANRGGSSFGVFKVEEKESLTTAIKAAFQEDAQLIIESALEGREVSVGVIDWEGAVKVLPITEIISENAFFDYAAKYEGKAQEITPAPIDSVTEMAVRTMAEKIYTTLGLAGFSRSEFILVEGVPHLLEVNTIPGLTKQSILPQQLQAAGISLEDFFNGLLNTALSKKNYI